MKQRREALAMRSRSVAFERRERPAFDGTVRAEALQVVEEEPGMGWPREGARTGDEDALAAARGLLLGIAIGALCWIPLVGLLSLLGLLPSLRG
jgi:hypothetical protein